MKVIRSGFRIISVITGFVLVLLLVKSAGVSNLLTSFENFQIRYLFVAIAVYLVTWFLRIEVIRKLTENYNGQISRREAFTSTIAGYALNILLPAKIGDLYRIYYFRTIIGFRKGTMVVVQSRIMDFLSLLFLASITIVVNSQVRFQPWLNWSILPFGLLAFCPFFIFFDKKNKIGQFLTSTLTKIKGFWFYNISKKIYEYYEEYRKLVLNWKLALKVILITLLIWIGEAVVAMILSFGFKEPINLSAIILANSVGNIVKALPVTPGGLGIYEGAFTLILKQLNVSYDTAISLALMDHIMKHGLVLLLGIPAASNFIIKKVNIN